jgi:hypothetical protein
MRLFRIFRKLRPQTAAPVAVDVVTIREDGCTIRIETQNGVIARLYVNGRLYTAQMLADNKGGELIPAHGVGMAIRYGVLNKGGGIYANR